MKAPVRLEAWRRDPRVTVRRMALVWAAPTVLWILASGLGEPKSDGTGGGYDPQWIAIIAGGSGLYAMLLALPDHFLARRGRSALVAAHMAPVVLAGAALGVFWAKHTVDAIVASVFLVVMAGALALVGVTVLNHIPGSLPPSPAKPPGVSVATLGGDGAPK